MMRITSMDDAMFGELWSIFKLTYQLTGRLDLATEQFKRDYPRVSQSIIDALWEKAIETRTTEAQQNTIKNKEISTVNETSAPDPTPDKGPAQTPLKASTEPQKRTVKYDPRNNAKAIAKELLINFLNADRNRRRKGYKISTIYKTVEWVHEITERTMRNYLEELYKGNQVKRWEERVTLDSGQVVQHYWFTLTANLDPKYHLWLTK
jgi:hypothetical protein